VLRKIFKVVVLLVVLNAAYQVVPPYWRYTRFKAELENLARAAKGKSDTVILDEVMELAAAHSIVLERDWVTISRAPDLTHTYIEATWAEPLTPAPGWKYLWVPKVRVDGLHLRPVVPRDRR
jgi:hypothetical protein